MGAACRALVSVDDYARSVRESGRRRGAMGYSVHSIIAGGWAALARAAAL